MLLKKSSVALLSLCLLSCLWFSKAEAVPSRPGEHRHVQKDGSVVFYQLNGDEFLNFMTDRQGNLIAFGDDGDLYFANWASQDDFSSSFGSSAPPRSFVVPTAVKAISAPASSLSRFAPSDVQSKDTMRTPIPQYIIDQAEGARRERDEAWREQHELSSLQREKDVFAPALFSSSATIEKELLVIYVKFADQSNLGELEDESLSREYINDLIFNDDKFGTVAHYYKTVTGGEVKIIPTQETSGSLNDGIVEVTIPGQHPDTRDNFILEREKLILPALTAADPYVNYAKSPVQLWNYMRSDLSIVLIVQGYESTSGAMPGTHPSVWGHATTWGNYGGDPDDVYIKYCVFGAYDDALSPHPFTMGIVAHELGHHMFGFKDFYTYGGDTYGVSDFWSLMGSGSSAKASEDEYDGSTPMGLDAYHLSMILPPTAEKEVTDTKIKEYSLTDVAQFMKLTTANPKEYFLLQPRGDVGYDRGLRYNLNWDWPTPGSGLIIYHIDESVLDERWGVFLPDWQTHPFFDIEEAHGGKQNLQDNSGIAHPDDLFHAAKSSFNATTDPNSNLYDNAGAATQNTASGISVTDIVSAVTGKNTQAGQVEVTFKVGTAAVNISPVGISFNNTALELLVGESAPLVPMFSPANTSNQSVSWSSDNPSVASVNAGLVTANGIGATTIRAQSKENPTLEATCAVTVDTMSVTLLSATANGSPDVTSTQITLVFDKPISGLFELGLENIKLENFAGIIGGLGVGDMLDGGTVWTFPIFDISNTGTPNVSVANFGSYEFIGQPKTVTVYKAPSATSVELQSVTANGLSEETSTQITLVFDKPIIDLNINDIKFGDGNPFPFIGGQMSGSGTTWTISFYGVFKTRTLDVSVANFSSYVFSGQSKSVTVYKALSTIPVELQSAVANGSPEVTSTKIDLVFDTPVTGLTADRIIIASDTGSVVKGTVSGSGTIWSVSLADVIITGTVRVSAVNFGSYEFNTPPRTVAVYKSSSATPVELQSVVANGSAEVTSMKIDLVFDTPVTGLTADKIIIANGTGSVVKGLSVSGSGTTWSITLDGVISAGTVSASVANFGSYEFNTPPQTVEVFKASSATPVELRSAVANGSAEVTSTKIDLIFDTPVTGLTADKIIIANDTGSVVKGSSVSGSGTTWSITLEGVSSAGTVNASVANFGSYVFSGSPQTTTVYKTLNPAPAYGIRLSETATVTFPTIIEGGSVPQARVVKVTNTGSQDTGALKIALSGANAGSFTLSKPSIGNIATGGTDNFSVVPNSNLVAGTYTATVTVSGYNGISANFNVSFMVNALAESLDDDDDDNGNAGGGGCSATSVGVLGVLALVGYSTSKKRYVK